MPLSTKSSSLQLCFLVNKQTYASNWLKKLSTTISSLSKRETTTWETLWSTFIWTKFLTQILIFLSTHRLLQWLTFKLMTGLLPSDQSLSRIRLFPWEKPMWSKAGTLCRWDIWPLTTKIALACTLLLTVQISSNICTRSSKLSIASACSPASTSPT